MSAKWIPRTVAALLVTAFQLVAATGKRAEVRVVSCTRSRTVIEVTTPAAEVRSASIDSRFSEVVVPGASPSQLAHGRPAVPRIPVAIAVPHGADVSIDVELADVEARAVGPVLPLQPVPTWGRSPASAFSFDSTFYVTDIAYPEQRVVRTGGANWRGLGFDLSETRLEYRLPYLDPMQGYRLRMLLAHAGSGSWSQQVLMDDSFAATVEFDSIGIDTVWLDVPQKRYRSDAAVRFRLDRVSGKYAVVAGLSLYQVAPGRGTDGGAAGQPSALGARLALLECAPNPFGARTTIAYDLPHALAASINIYDASGRHTRTLLSGAASGPGRFSLAWDGRDQSGRRLPAGMYFVRLQADGRELSSKVVLTD